MKKLLAIIFCCFGLWMTTPQLSEVSAQCPMCRMSAESNLKEGGTAGRGLNRGILYMLAMPYLLVGTLGYVWYHNQLKYEAES